MIFSRRESDSCLYWVLPLRCEPCILYICVRQPYEYRVAEDLDKIKAAFRTVSSYVGITDNWIVVKREVLKNIHPDLRAKFSRRDPLTKLANLNDMEQGLIEWYEEAFGVRLRLPY